LQIDRLHVSLWLYGNRILESLTVEPDQLLRRAGSALRDAFGDRVRGVILYGSEARGEAQSDSDIDLLVLLSGPVDHGRDSRTCIDALYDLVLELERPIHAKPVDVKDYDAQKAPLYREARREGIRV
jgi:predicted nucleotidyltransferase